MHQNPGSRPHQKPRVTIFLGGRLIDGSGGPVVHDSCVVVSGGAITFAGKRNGSPLPEVGDRMDITGKTIMPGLIDAHVHIGNISLKMEETAALSPAVYVHRATRNLETDLNMGFTTLRDAGGLDWSFSDATDQGLINGPRLFLSIHPLTPTGGHFDMRGIYGSTVVARNSLGIRPEVCDGPDAVYKAAREVLRRGARQIKITADGGVDSPSDQPGHWQFSVPELKAAVSVAEAAGTYVMAHVYSARAIHNCLDAGVRSIEHGNLLDAETARRMAAAGAYLVPTLTVYDVMGREGRDGLAHYARNKLDQVAGAGKQAVGNAREAGVMIASGSDIYGPYQHLKGREVSLKAELLSPMEALVSATSTNARLLNMEDRIGTLTAGKDADLIVLDGDPLADPELFERARETVLLVMKTGRIMKNRLAASERQDG